MNIRLRDFKVKSNTVPIVVPGSKSESNRLLILKAWHPSITIENLSTAVDTVNLKKALTLPIDNIVDVHHAGTAMRFLTAYFSAQDNIKVTLTGSGRMQERPIGILVDALLELGAEISYIYEKGFPPLSIKGKKLSGGTLILDASVSSQYVTALLLIAPYLENGLQLNFKKRPTSLPYIDMTVSLLKEIGVDCFFENNVVRIAPFLGKLQKEHFVVCSDWSSASYFFSAVAMSPIGTKVALSNFQKDSLQGDAQVMEIYKQFGVSSTQLNGTLIIEKTSQELPDKLELDLNQTPDLAQTIAVTCLGLKLPCQLTGLHTLKIKETDRLIALKTEMQKCNATVNITDDSLSLKAAGEFPKEVIIDTYSDHRMAMSFAPLSIFNAIVLRDAKVVQKSYPNFWEDFQRIGLNWEVY